MFALLGDIKLDLGTSPETLNTTYGSDFAELDRINGKPGLQYIGGKLDEYSWSFTLHYRYADPLVLWQKIQALHAAHQAVAVVIGHDYPGWFVVTDATRNITLATPGGQIQALSVTLTLREFTGDPNKPPAPVAVKSGLPGAGAVTKPLQRATGITGLLHTAVTAARTAQSALSTASNVVRVARQFKRNPVAALSRVPGMINSFGPITQSLETAFPALAGLSAQLPEAARVAKAGSRIVSLVDTGADVLRRLDLKNPANLSGVFDQVSGVVGEATTVMNEVSPYLSQLSARMITRSL
ncbi:phage tail protein [Morganella morganii]|nr:phage tail protein [Morganella morganii]